MDTQHVTYPRTYIPHFLPWYVAETHFQHLLKSLDRKQYEIALFGKVMLQPRLISFYGDPWVRYTYSKTTFEGIWREETLYNIKTRIEQHTWHLFNSVLCNLYRNWNDSMWRHSDNEKELGSDPIIASLSLWSERVFHIRNKQTKEKQKILLQRGSLLVMEHGSQLERQHAIMKTKKPLWPRINITFRNIVA